MDHCTDARPRPLTKADAADVADELLESDTMPADLVEKLRRLPREKQVDLVGLMAHMADTGHNLAEDRRCECDWKWWTS